MYQIITAAVGAIIGGITNGVTTAVTTNKKVEALKKASEQAYNLAREYSGTNLNRKMTEAGQRNAQELSRESLANQLNNYQPTTGNAMANVNNRSQFNSNYADFYNQGANREAQMANAAYNKGAADIERNLKQADIDYNVTNQTSQAVMNGVGNVAGTIGDMGSFNKNNTATSNATSDENCKEPINNDSGLPRADIQDSLRQLESVKYKYTDEAQENVPGTDNEEHVGTVTQSMEKTPLFKDAVVHDENGIGKVDLFRLNEAIEAGLAEMQREIDELSSNTVTSDERCKEMETEIESNPVEAAQTLPQGSDIQKEALEAIDGGKDAEVNNKVVDKFVNNQQDIDFDNFMQQVEDGTFLPQKTKTEPKQGTQKPEDLDDEDFYSFLQQKVDEAGKVSNPVTKDVSAKELNDPGIDFESFVNNLEDEATSPKAKETLAKYNKVMQNYPPEIANILSDKIRNTYTTFARGKTAQATNMGNRFSNPIELLNAEEGRTISKEEKDFWADEINKALDDPEKILRNSRGLDLRNPETRKYFEEKYGHDWVKKQDKYSLNRSLRNQNIEIAKNAFKYLDSSLPEGKSKYEIINDIINGRIDPEGIFTMPPSMKSNGSRISSQLLSKRKAAFDALKTIGKNNEIQKYLQSRFDDIVDVSEYWNTPKEDLLKNIKKQITGDLEQAVEQEPEEIIEVLPDSNAAEEASQIINDNDKRNDEANNEKLEEDVKKYTPEEINDALAEVNNVNYDLIRGKGKKRTKQEDEEIEKWLEEQEQKDQIEMNPGAFLPEPYKALAKSGPRDVDNYWTKVDNEYPWYPEDVEYSIRDAEEAEGTQLPIDYSDREFIIPPIGLKSNPETFGYDRPNISADNIAATDNSLDLDSNTHTVAGGSTTRPSFGGGGSGGGASTGSSITPNVSQQNKAPTPGRSFGGGRLNLLGGTTNPIAVAHSSVGGGVTSGKVERTSDPNISKGGHLAESRTKLPDGWANNQVAGGNLDISAGDDYQDKSNMSNEGNLLSAELKMILQEDSLNWDGNNSGDKYAPYLFWISNNKFFVQKGREKHLIDNSDPKEIAELIKVVNSNK